MPMATSREVRKLDQKRATSRWKTKSGVKLNNWAINSFRGLSLARVPRGYLSISAVVKRAVALMQRDRALNLASTACCNSPREYDAEE